jgi:hypothetical protein
MIIRHPVQNKSVEFGARALRSYAEVAAQTLVEQIRVWDRDGRYVLESVFGSWPVGADQSEIPSGVAVARKPYGVITILSPVKD